MKRMIAWVLVLCLVLSLSFAFAGEGGNYSDEMKFDDGMDLSAEDGVAPQKMGSVPFSNSLPVFH